MDVFFRDARVPTDNTELPFRECAHRRTEAQEEGIIQCEYYCMSRFTSHSTYVKFSRAKHINAHYGNRALNAIRIHKSP